MNGEIRDREKVMRGLKISEYICPTWLSNEGYDGWMRFQDGSDATEPASKLSLALGL